MCTRSERSSFNLDRFQFLRCGQDNCLTIVDSDLSGDGVVELAGQGSIYICLLRVMYVY